MSCFAYNQFDLKLYLFFTLQKSVDNNDLYFSCVCVRERERGRDMAREKILPS